MSNLTRPIQHLTNSYQLYLDSFARHLQAENKSDRTVQTYSEAVTQFAKFCREKGMPADLADVTREHIAGKREEALRGIGHRPAMVDAMGLPRAGVEVAVSCVGAARKR